MAQDVRSRLPYYLRDGAADATLNAGIHIALPDGGHGMNEAAPEPNAQTERQSTRRQTVVAAALVILGLALIATGIAAVFTTTNDVGSAALMAMGGLLFLLGAIGDRLESLRYGDLEVVLRRKAEEASKRGDTETAQALQRAADRIASRVKSSSHSYKRIRSSMPAGQPRTEQMQEIILAAHDDATDPSLDEEQVLQLLWTGSEGARVWALGVLQQKPELATVRSILEAVSRPDQMFDQYQALVLAEAFLEHPSIRAWSRERILRAVRHQLDSGALGEDEDSLRVARRILGQEPTS
jgi:hypothetical protein